MESPSKAAVSKKKKLLDFSDARLEKFTEGLCVQVMHIGAYDDEPATIRALKEFAVESGYIFDTADDAVKTLSRRHHEIYISDPKNRQKKMKTVIRYPIRYTV